MMTDKKKPDQSKISLAPLSFEEALKGLLAVPPPPKEPKPKKGSGKKKDGTVEDKSIPIHLAGDGTGYTVQPAGGEYLVAHMVLDVENKPIRLVAIPTSSFSTFAAADEECERRANGEAPRDE